MNQELRTKNAWLCESLALPVYPELAETQAAYVVDSISEFFRSQER